MTYDRVYHMRYITLQIQEMREHAYYLSQRMNCDAGGVADMDWCTHRYTDIGDKTQAERYADDFERNHDRIMACCNAVCGKGVCGGRGNCPIGLRVIHRLLGD